MEKQETSAENTQTGIIALTFSIIRLLHRENFVVKVIVEVYNRGIDRHSLCNNRLSFRFIRAAYILGSEMCCRKIALHGESFMIKITIEFCNRGMDRHSAVIDRPLVLYVY